MNVMYQEINKSYLVLMMFIVWVTGFVTAVVECRMNMKFIRDLFVNRWLS